MLASGAYSRSVTITHCLLLLFSDRFKLQSLAKYMFTLETQSATFLPPLPMTHANPYDFPQMPLTQIKPDRDPPSAVPLSLRPVARHIDLDTMD